MAKAPPVDKRRQILDAAIRVFARQGFHATRVSDIADEAGVAYGLVYHYFRRDIDPAFASMSFYGAIEQLLSGWIFEVIPASDTSFAQAKELVVTTICDGLEHR